VLANDPGETRTLDLRIATSIGGATEIAGQENAGLEIDGQKLQGVENDGHSIKG